MCSFLPSEISKNEKKTEKCFGVFDCSVEPEDLNFAPNAHLRQTVEKILKNGIAISKNTSISRGEREEGDTLDDFFVYKNYIFELDEIQYKIEAHLNLSLFSEMAQNTTEEELKEESKNITRNDNEIHNFSIFKQNEKKAIEEDNDKSMTKNICNEVNEHETIIQSNEKNVFDDKTEIIKLLKEVEKGESVDEKEEKLTYVKPDVFFVYVHHPFFHQIWQDGASDTILFYFAESTTCRCNEIFDDFEKFQLEIQIFVPQDPKICDELALQISKIRERLLCGPFQRFFRTVGSKVSSSSFFLQNSKNIKIRDKHVQIRKNEIIWLFPQDNFIDAVFSINYSSEFDAYLAKIWCRELEENSKNDTIYFGRLKITFCSDTPSSVLHYLQKKKLQTAAANVGYLSLHIDMNILKYEDSRLRAYSATRLGNILGSLRSFLDSKVLDMRKSLRISHQKFSEQISQLCERLL